MTFPWQDLMATIRAGESLPQADMAAAVDAIMEGRGEAGEVEAFLVRLHERGETAAEMAGAAESMRRHMCRVDTTRWPLVDTCGTGGDGTSTFNISTAAAIVAAACGVAVAKHGNRSVTSRTGSADVLEALGVAVDLPPDRVARCIDEVGIGFCFAPRMHPAMRRVAEVRRKISTPTIFNLIGPLANPAGAPHQLIGVGREGLLPQLAGAVALLGTSRTLLVRGRDRLDEVTTGGPTDVIEVESSGSPRSFTWTPDDFGLPTRSWESARVSDARQSAAMIRDVLGGAPGVPRDLVLLNAAATLALVDPGPTLEQHALRAAEAIDRGMAAQRLNDWIEMSHA